MKTYPLYASSLISLLLFSSCDDNAVVTIAKEQTSKVINSDNSSPTPHAIQTNPTIKNKKTNPQIIDKNPNTPQFSSIDLSNKYRQNLYSFYSFDVNTDGINDKIITHKNSDDKSSDYRYQGNELFVYLGDSDHLYTLSLETINFTDEAGWFLSGITPRADRSGFILNNYFAGRGHSQQLFYFTFKDNNWWISNYVSEGTLISGVSYYCFKKQYSGINNVDQGQSSNYSEVEFTKYCPPLPNKYQVNSDKLEILDESFNPQEPANYYIKGDVIDVLSQNEEWVKVRYKHDSKYGWVDKRYLVPLFDKTNGK